MPPPTIKTGTRVSEDIFEALMRVWRERHKVCEDRARAGLYIVAEPNRYRINDTICAEIPARDPVDIDDCVAYTHARSGDWDGGNSLVEILSS